MMKYKKVIVTKRGGPETLKVIEEDLHPAAPDEVRIRVLAAPVTLPDVEARYGRTPFTPKIPFVPGYAAIGDVEKIGEDVKKTKVGDRVAALTAYGGYSEYMFLKEGQLIPVPSSADPGESIP
jgi:NADPH:quinone reductase-like Zn-dependent oxidoreductase